MAETDKDDLVSLLEDTDGKIDIPEIMPLLPVRDVVIFTDMVLPLFIGRERSVKAVDKSMGGDRLLFLSTQKDPSIEDPKPDDIYKVGTICRILRICSEFPGAILCAPRERASTRHGDYTLSRRVSGTIALVTLACICV